MRGVSALCVLNLNDIVWVLKSSPPEQVMCSMKVIPIGRWSLWVLLYELFPNTTEQCHVNQCYSVCPLFPIHLWAATRPTGSYLLLCLPPENGLTLINFHAFPLLALHFCGLVQLGPDQCCAMLCCCPHLVVNTCTPPIQRWAGMGILCEELCSLSLPPSILSTDWQARYLISVVQSFCCCSHISKHLHSPHSVMGWNGSLM